MSSNYPTSLDALSTAHVDNVQEAVRAATINDLADAVNKIETELGTLPKGGSADVKARIAATETVANAAIPKSLVTTAGDLIYATASATLARLGIGTASQVLGGGASAPAWVTPPGAEIGYAQITSPVNVASTTESAGTTIISPGAITFDGAAVMVEFFSPEVVQPAAVSQFLIVSLFEGATQIGRLCAFESGVASANGPQAVGRLRFTPSVGSHTYTVTAFATNTTGTPSIQAGASGTGTAVPAFVRFTKV